MVQGLRGQVAEIAGRERDPINNKEDLFMSRFEFNDPSAVSCGAPTCGPMPTMSDVVTDTAKILQETICILNDIRRTLKGMEPSPDGRAPTDKPPCMLDRLMFNAEKASEARFLTEEIYQTIGECR